MKIACSTSHSECYNRTLQHVSLVLLPICVDTNEVWSAELALAVVHDEHKFPFGRLNSQCWYNICLPKLSTAPGRFKFIAYSLAWNIMSRWSGGKVLHIFVRCYANTGMSFFIMGAWMIDDKWKVHTFMYEWMHMYGCMHVLISIYYPCHHRSTYRFDNIRPSFEIRTTPAELYLSVKWHHCCYQGVSR